MPIMTTQSTKTNPSIIADWLEIAEAYEHRPTEATVPDSPEAVEAMVELISSVYGDALRELAKN